MIGGGGSRGSGNSSNGSNNPKNWKFKDRITRYSKESRKLYINFNATLDTSSSLTPIWPDTFFLNFWIILSCHVANDSAKKIGDFLDRITR